MKIIISPAKKMLTNETIFPFTEPLFLNKSNELIKKLKLLSFEDIKKYFKCNNSLALKAYNDYQDFEKLPYSPAIYSYSGIQYNYMQAKVFTNDELKFLQEHLYIISGLYGLVKPLDYIKPYRLEMGLKVKDISLYDYWNTSLAEQLKKEDNIFLNLASNEYSKAVSPYLELVNVFFYEEENNKLIEKGVYCKMARGMMVRYIVENKIQTLEEIKKFSLADYKFNNELSNGNNLIFIRKK